MKLCSSTNRRKPLWKCRTVLLGSFPGWILLIGFASAIGGASTGIFAGMWNWLLSGGAYSWWYLTSYELYQDAMAMMIFGWMVGGLVCTAILTVELKWNPMRKGRFCLYFARHLLLPMLSGLAIIPVVVTVSWLGNNGWVITSASYDLPRTIMKTEIFMLLALSICAGFSSVHFSKKDSGQASRARKRAAVLSERLLPLD